MYSRLDDWLLSRNLFNIHCLSLSMKDLVLLDGPGLRNRPILEAHSIPWKMCSHPIERERGLRGLQSRSGHRAQVGMIVDSTTLTG